MSDQKTLRGPTFIEKARREQIIACAVATIAERGYGGASLAQIARRAGISTGVISYYFANKEALIEQVVTTIYTAGAHYMIPRIQAQTTPGAMLRAYIRSNVEFIGQHRPQVIALAEIFGNFRTTGGKLRYDLEAEEPHLAALESLLRSGQLTGEFRDFNARVMAITIRRAIDALPQQLAANAQPDIDAYARELVTLFDLATRRLPANAPQANEAP